MNDELSRLFAAERAETPPDELAVRGLDTFDASLRADVPSLAVARGPLKLGLSATAKSVVGSGLLAFVVTTGGLSLHAAIQASSTHHATSATAAAAAASSATRRLATSIAMPQPREEPELAPEPSARAATVHGGAPVPEQASTFSDELRLIKAAKRELDAQHEHLARVWLEQHARVYPKGVFSRERETLLGRLSSGGYGSVAEEPADK